MLAAIDALFPSSCQQIEIMLIRDKLPVEETLAYLEELNSDEEDNIQDALSWDESDEDVNEAVDSKSKESASGSESKERNGSEEILGKDGTSGQQS